MDNVFLYNVGEIITKTLKLALSELPKLLNVLKKLQVKFISIEQISWHFKTNALTFRINDNTPEIDKHPEKRMKAAFEDFEKVRLPELKTENPTLRLSQLKQLLRKEWQKHPTNPINRQLAELAKASQAS